jgi:hypothetical protein
VVFSQDNWLEPEFTDSLISPHVNMLWFITVKTVTEEAVWPRNTRNNRHAAMLGGTAQEINAAYAAKSLTRLARFPRPSQNVLRRARPARAAGEADVGRRAAYRRRHVHIERMRKPLCHILDIHDG